MTGSFYPFLFKRYNRERYRRKIIDLRKSHLLHEYKQQLNMSVHVF